MSSGCQISRGGKIDLIKGFALAAGVRLLCLFSPLLILVACRDDSTNDSSSEPEPEKLVSYSLEVRPFLIKSCTACHGDLPLHDPAAWNLLHEHEEEVEIPETLQKWVIQGSQVDPHWAGLPLRKVSGNSADDFIELEVELPEVARELPQAMFTAPVADLLAGDLMSKKERAISTGYLRQGKDTPKWRAEKVAREFLGVRVACASCHDHPSEYWSRDRHSKLTELFTTPFDKTPDSLAPLFVRVAEDASQKLAVLEKQITETTATPPVVEEDYLDWVALDQEAPALPGLVAAFSFEGRSLNNLAPLSRVVADGKDLIAENGVHGEGLLFDEKNEFILTQLPGSTELDRFTLSAWIKLGPENLADTSIATMGTRARGFEFRVTNGKLQARWTRFWPQYAAVVTSKIPLIAPNRWCHVAVTYDGSRRATGMQIYLNGSPIEVVAEPTKLLKSVLTQGGPLVFSGKGLWLDELQIYDDVLTPIGVRQVFDGRSLVTAYQEGRDLREFYQRHFGKGEESRRAQVRAGNGELLKIQDELAVYLVMAGNPEHEILEGSKEPANRLEFAERLNKDLMARALANEVWRTHFGVPLAHSLGFSDPLPDHPNLLEWLAGELKRSDYDVAKLGTLIRESKAWTREWPGLKSEAATCPRTTE
jgi:hypothetical protein